MCPWNPMKMRLILGSSSTEMELELDLKGQRKNEGPWAETWLKRRVHYIILCLGLPLSFESYSSCLSDLPSPLGCCHPNSQECPFLAQCAKLPLVEEKAELSWTHISCPPFIFPSLVSLGPITKIPRPGGLNYRYLFLTVRRRSPGSRCQPVGW